MPMTGGDAAGDELFVPFEEEETDIWASADHNVSVAALARRAGDDPMSARGPRLVDPGCNRVQPRPAILIGQRNTLVHLFDIGGRVEPIAILEFPLQACGEKRSDGR